MMAIVTGDRYLEKLVKFLEDQAEPLIEGTKVLKLNPAGLHYVHLRLDALQELERMLSGAPVDYLRAYVSDLGDYRALEQLRKILCLLTSLKVISALPPPARDPTPLSLLPFGRLKVLELRGCDLSTSAAKGLLELRHTLEKIICHNSTDALRHVFASRISEIKDSPQWNKLSFVSCASNRLVLMDESLQLLPAVETLDLSRNRFAKVDNLWRCTKLKHLDLGFNHLRTISYFSEVCCHIVKLVLRNNALTTLRGIENLKSLEGLDVSYNIISKFSELEFLGSLPWLRTLWLEGNPVCCARWYRAQTFSYFVYPHSLKLDGKEISTREFWKRKIIVAHRQKLPAGFGFYFPARDDAEGGSGNRKKKKVSRLASIDSEEESTYICSDQEFASCNHEIQSKEENGKSDDEAEISDLINKVEHLKKERSVLWLQEFKEWMDNSSQDFADISNYNWSIHIENKKKKNQRRHGESSRFALGSVKASGDECNRDTLEFDDSFADLPTDLVAAQYVDGDGTLKTTGEISSLGTGKRDLNHEYQKSSHEEMGTMSIWRKGLRHEGFVMEGRVTAENDSVNAIDGIAGSLSSSVSLSSPPHYQKDVLHRRHNLVEEILQLSADSFSVASSDSMTSCSEDEVFDSESIHEDKELAVQGFLNETKNQQFVSGASKDDACHQREEKPGLAENIICLLGSQPENTSNIIQNFQTLISGASNFFTGNHGAEHSSLVNQDGDWFEKRKGRREPKRRVVSLLEENTIVMNGETSQRSDLDVSGASKDGCNGCFSQHIRENSVTPSRNNHSRFFGVECTDSERDDLVEAYIREKVADSGIKETCRFYLRCECILEQDSTYKRRELVLLLSDKNTLYMLLVGASLDDRGSSVSLLGMHRIEDVRDVSVGLGLQIVRVYIEEGGIYLFITKNIEKSTELLNMLQVFDSEAAAPKCSLRSLEQVQVESFRKHICGGLSLSIFQYVVLSFNCSMFGEKSWLPRSLFVAGQHLFICIEDFTQFSSLSWDASSASYFSLHMCCAISDVCNVVIESRESACLSLEIKRVASEFYPYSKPDGNSAANKNRRKQAGESTTWKLKWFNEESLLKFVALLKALHAGTKQWPLLVRHT